MSGLMESEVRSYSRSYPTIFDSAVGSVITDINGRNYLDFLAGCGSLNYGHNHPALREALVNYISDNGITMSMDMFTKAREAFIRSFNAHILEPRNLDYRMQFCGPTGANAVEAAIKLARKTTGRTNVIAFTNGFHGCSLGALSLTGNKNQRASSSSLLTNVSRFPYAGYMVDELLPAELLRKMLGDPSSGCDEPAAIIFEAVQGEGGLNTATRQWAKAIVSIAEEHGAVLILDEVQAGCGRTGTFFAFESLGIEPDMVTMAKSISGYGLPMSLLLMKPSLDQWQPGEHNGTFRGNNLAFVTATKAINTFWASADFSASVAKNIEFLATRIEHIAGRFGLRSKGRGMMRGLQFRNSETCAAVRRQCFEQGLIIETCGPFDEVLKFLPPLTSTIDELAEGLDIVERAISHHLSSADLLEGQEYERQTA